MSKLAARIYDRWLRWLAPRKQPLKRRYAAARVDRLNSGWETQSWTTNFILRQDLRALRSRARQMCRDTPHFKKFLSMVRSNVIGPQGMRLQCRARKTDNSLDLDLNKRIEEAFWNWGHRETCSVTQRLDWIAAQRLFVTQLARDGEVLAQKMPADNPFGFSLKFIDVDYLDETYNQEQPDGGRIVMSVELDPQGTPRAYWLTTPPSDIMFVKRRERQRTRVPAEMMIHAFLVVDDESQVRGVTWFHASLLKARNMDVYVDSVIEQAKMTAMTGGFFSKKTADGGDTQYDGQTDAEGKPVFPEIDMQPASFWVVPDDMEFKQFDPKQPTQNHAQFVQEGLAHIAAGLDLPYFSLAGDLSSVNYSSARIGLGEEREIWRSLQQFVASVFCRPVYHEWLRASVLSGAIKLTKAEYIEVLNPVFRGRGWKYIDPMKEVNASVTALANNLATLTDELGEQGIDIVDHFETIKAERELASKYGIDLVYVTKVTATETPDPAAGEGDSKPADGKKPPPKRELTNGHGLQHLGDDVS